MKTVFDSWIFDSETKQIAYYIPDNSKQLRSIIEKIDGCYIYGEQLNEKRLLVCVLKEKKKEFEKIIKNFFKNKGENK